MSLRRIVVYTLALALLPTAAWAQTWEPPDSRPLLREIIAVDGSGEPGWPFGSEDIAGDGATWSTDEARLDIRTVYATSETNRFWLRAYFGADQTPTFDTAVLFVFVDNDGNPGTGGGADASDLFGEFVNDPTPGGYDAVVGVKADGSVLGVWSWDNGRNRWRMETEQPGEIAVESGLDVDPIRIGTDRRAYLQVDVAHSLTGLNASCNANIFVRSFNDATTVAYGDLNVGGGVPCVAADTNNDGDPDLLQQPSTGCSTDADCPGQGVCTGNGVCLIGYECTGDADCRTDETCSGNVCVRTVTTQCTSDSDCNGLVCDGGSCVACTDGGARACGGDLVCAPNGTCRTPGTTTPPAQGDGVDQVQGGACMCQLTSSETRTAPGLLTLVMALAALVFTRRRRASRDDAEA